MRIVDIDYYALTGDSLLHKTSCELKILWMLALIFLVVTVNDYNVLLPVYLLMLLYIILSKLPSRLILLLSSYPLIFALLFIIAASNITPGFVLVMCLKVLIASTTVILLFTTTTYIKLFSKLNRFLPGFLLTTLFLTYRAIFILWSTFENIQNHIYLRGGISFKNPKRSLQVIGNSLGFLVIRSIESSEKMYEGMRLRGHSDKLRYLEDKKWTE